MYLLVDIAAQGHDATGVYGLKDVGITVQRLLLPVKNAPVFSALTLSPGSACVWRAVR